jgi:hypothetical protein
MSRSYHVTRKQANRAMAVDDLGPVWLESEKHWVKKKVKEERAVAKFSGPKGKLPNRTVVSAEKARTRRVSGKSRVDEVVDNALKKPNQSSQPTPQKRRG